MPRWQVRRVLGMRPMLAGVGTGLLLYFLYHFLPSKPTMDETGISAYQSCLGGEMEKDVTGPVPFGRPHWDFPRMIKQCKGKLPDSWFVGHATAKNEIGDPKMFILPTDQNAVTFVTLGIGGDVKVETEFKGWVPSVMFFGAEPFPQRALEYRSLGHVSLLAVSDRTGTGLLSNPEMRQAVQTMRFDEFLRDKVSSPQIDYLTMDVEGDEYKVLPLLSAVAKPICQLNVNLHAPLLAFGASKEAFRALGLGLLTKSDYLLLHSVTLPEERGATLFLVDYKTPYCLQRFWSTSEDKAES